MTFNKHKTQNNQLSLFAKQLAYMLAQITDGAEMALRFGVGCSTSSHWPTRARATNPLNEIIAFRLRQDHLESDLSDFIILKNRHEKTTGVPLDNDLLIHVDIAEEYWSIAAAPEVVCQEHLDVH